MIFKNRCYNGGRKHKFKARYNEVPNNLNIQKTNCSSSELRKLFYSKVYLLDICTWCGKKIKEKTDE